MKEPLVHFLLIGALLFVVFQWTGGDDTSASTERIVVGAGRIEQLATVFQKTWQRPPTPEELKGLIDDFVLEEIYYRQAVSMGIDRDDTVIRRRLRQKLEFLTDDAAALVAPTDEDFSAYLADHPDEFRESPTYTFRQAYFNPEKHADRTEQWLAEKLAAAESGDDSVGDPSLVPDSFDQETVRAVDATFGTGFSQALDALEVGRWHGPIRSGLGLHLIRLDERVPGRLPELDEIRPLVEREWSNTQRLESRKAMNEQLLKGYEVVIEWPQVEEQEAEKPGEGSGA